MSAERTLLVTIQLDSRFSDGEIPWSIEDEAGELIELAASAGGCIVGEIRARRHEPVAGTFLGRGKLDEIARLAGSTQAQVVIFNQELSPAQQRTIEDVLRIKTIDRTQLILDIFAQHAKSQEGKLQVELAQLRYLLPRLSGKGIMLSRLGGGIGTRGPGEQKLEVDRRCIRARIARLSNALQRLSRRRQATRSRRKEIEVPIAALIGYTNAGKTTLLNRLTGASGATQHQLFTTLDPLARRLKLPGGEVVILTDTVGFLHHLPHHLIEAFRATLEEARDADILLYVLDASHPLVTEHAEAVDEVLRELALNDKPKITILNKRDRIKDLRKLTALQRVHDPAVSISAKTGDGLDEFGDLVAERLATLLSEPTKLRIPDNRLDILGLLYQSGQVVHRKEQNGATEIMVRLPRKLRVQLSAYIYHAGTRSR